MTSTHRLELPDLRTGYIDLVNHVARHGTQANPRGLPIVELEDVTFTVANPWDTLPLGIGRDVSRSVAAVEALQLLAGESTPELLIAASSQFQNYCESDGQFHGAYGRRVGTQVRAVLEKLESDEDSRQAILTLWDPRLDNEPGHRDYPCTVALGFRLRRDQLNLSVLMRSDDCWLGVAYDVFVFTQLQWTLAHLLGVEPGTYTHTAWSLHLYERDLARLARLHPPSSAAAGELPEGLPPVRGRDLLDSWDETSDLALDLLRNPDSVRTNLTLNADVEWYQAQLIRVHGRVEKW